VIILTDDYSRGTWAYAMKPKSQALLKVQLFEAWIQRQFEAKVRQFLCDNGRELSPIPKGVEFDTSAPCFKQPKIKGLAERTN
jgi:hypothetical protein